MTQSSLPARTGVVPVRLVDAAGDFEIRIDVLGRAHPDSDDYEDGNWLRARVSVRTVSLSGAYEAQLRSEEFAFFRAGLGSLLDDPAATARFSPMEPWLEIEVAADGDGERYAAQVIAREAPDWGATLSFILQLPLADIADLVLALDAVTERYPVVGSPTA